MNRLPRTFTEFPLTEDAKRLLEGSWAQAQKFGHADITEEHILLSLADQSDTIAIQVLRNLGVNISDLQEELKRSLEQRPKTPTGKSET